jgi:predicted unusual protein kinase regulating ubiquinone biosynthesis (AarF/ABC1/UbiB family)
LYNYLKDETKQSKIVEKATKCGPLAIKLLQFMEMNGLLKKHLHLFEDCEQHPFYETEQLYYNDFGKGITRHYTIKNVLGSGSIGQVYLVERKSDNKLLAMKVKHPGINEKARDFGNTMKFLLCLFYPFISFYDMIIQFIDTIYVQLDYHSEVQNTINLRHVLKDLHSVIVPEVYCYSENFIIMSYHDGQSFPDITDELVKRKASVHMIFLTLSFLLVYDIFHGDLHYGNWKVNTQDRLKLVLYDCGILYSSNNPQFNKNIVEAISYNDYEKLLENCVVSLTPRTKRKIKKCIAVENIPVSKQVKTLVINSINEGIIKNKNFIHILQSYSIIMDTLFVGIDKMNTFFHKDNDIALLFSMYIELLERFGDFHELKVYLKEWMDSDSKYKLIVDQWCLDNFGHTDLGIIADILYSKLF